LSLTHATDKEGDATGMCWWRHRLDLQHRQQRQLIEQHAGCLDAAGSVGGFVVHHL
jgi:hypothetical protein